MRRVAPHINNYQHFNGAYAPKETEEYSVSKGRLESNEHRRGNLVDIESPSESNSKLLMKPSVDVETLHRQTQVRNDSVKSIPDSNISYKEHVEPFEMDPANRKPSNGKLKFPSEDDPMYIDKLFLKISDDLVKRGREYTPSESEVRKFSWQTGRIQPDDGIKRYRCKSSGIYKVVDGHSTRYYKP